MKKKPECSLHVVPMQDEREHELTTNCWCRPEFVAGEFCNAVTHNRLDESLPDEWEFKLERLTKRKGGSER